MEFKQLYSVADGTVEDAVSCMEMIRQSIPEKRHLDEASIRQRLSGDYGVKLLLKGCHVEGITIWHRTGGQDAYLWLGAVNQQGNGYGSLLVEECLKDMELRGYRSVGTKVCAANSRAISNLKGRGFAEVADLGDLLVMEKSYI